MSCCTPCTGRKSELRRRATSGASQGCLCTWNVYYTVNTCKDVTRETLGPPWRSSRHSPPRTWCQLQRLLNSITSALHLKERRARHEETPHYVRRFQAWTQNAFVLILLPGGNETFVNTVIYSILTSELCDITRHMGSHSVTLTCSVLTPAREGWYSIYLPRRDGRLSSPRWLVIYQDGLPAHSRSSIQVLTGPDVEQLRWSRPTRLHYAMPLLIDRLQRISIQAETSSIWSESYNETVMCRYLFSHKQKQPRRQMKFRNTDSFNGFEQFLKTILFSHF